MATNRAPQGDGTSAILGLRRVQSSYSQVADQLRDLIIRGDLVVGQKLPSEAELAPMMGVSRSTIREALRILTTEHLIETKRGIQGGAFVASPDSDRLEGMFSTSFSMLALTNQVDAQSFLQAMRALEGPAAALAAAARGGDQVEEMERTLALVDPDDQEVAMLHSSEFHTAILKASGNKLLEAMGRPVSTVARAKFRRTAPGLEFWESNQRRHREMFEAIVAGDEKLAYDLATRHIDHDLAPFYLPAEAAEDVVE